MDARIVRGNDQGGAALACGLKQQFDDWLALSSRLAVGSSTSNSLGWRNNARARATRCA